MNPTENNELQRWEPRENWNSGNQPIPVHRSQSQKQETVELMYWANKIYSWQLQRLVIRNQNPEHINHKLTYLLHDPYTFICAYAQISKHKGAITEGPISSATTMSWFGQINAIHIANQFKTGTYKFRPVRRLLMPKTGQPGKTRPIDTLTKEDRIVQEAIRGILEAIFEPEFEAFEKQTNFQVTNYGFRPHKTCMDAVETFKKQGQTVTYVLEGDIKLAYNSVNQQVLLQILNRRIKDKKFLAIIKEMFQSGILHDGNFQHSLLGVPQGGIASPILFNIYMFELDKYVYKLMKRYAINPNPVVNPTYKNLGDKIRKLAENKPEGYRKEIQLFQKEKFNISTYAIGTNPRNPIFVRYADDWVFGLCCTKVEAEKVKRNISIFLKLYLKLTLDPDKTLISHLQRDGFRFLGYEIKMFTPEQTKIALCLTTTTYGTFRVKKRTTSRKINIRPDKETIFRNLISKKICDGLHFPIGVPAWAQLEEFRIVERYRSIMLGIYNYYCKCDDHYVLNHISYILQFSCAKTIARRKQISMKQVFEKYGRNLRVELEIFSSPEESKTRTTSFLTYTELKKKGDLNRAKTPAQLPDPFKIQPTYKPNSNSFPPIDKR